MANRAEDRTMDGLAAIDFAERFGLPIQKYGSLSSVSAEDARRTTARFSRLIYVVVPERMAVQGGKGEDHDTGQYLGHRYRSTVPGDTIEIYVAWNSGVRTWTPATDLEKA